MRVGVSQSRGLCDLKEGAEPTGIEVQLIKGYARSIGAEIEWVQGSQEQIVELLKVYEVDLAVGGYTNKTSFKKHIALSRPYNIEHIKVGAPQNIAIPDDIEGKKVVVKKAGAARAAVKKNKGTPVEKDSVSGSDQLVAGSKDELLKLGFKVSDYNLNKVEHVVAIPKGENALLKSLENYIYTEWMEKKIKASL